MRREFFAVAVLLLAPACQSNLISSPKLVGGRPVSANVSFPSVLIWTSYDVKLKESYCTGAKVSEFMILTAAHCVLMQTPLAGKVYLGPWSAQPSMNPGQKIRYSFDNDLGSITAKEGSLTIKKVHLPPLVNACLKDPAQNSLDCQNRAPHPDIAVIELIQHNNSQFRSRPGSKIDYSFVKPGRRMIMTGFGSEGQNSTVKPRLKYKFTKVTSLKKLSNALQSTFATLDGFPDEAYFFSSTRKTTDSRPANLGSGDSGGPAFDSKTRKIIGVNSDAYCPLTNRNCQLTNNSIFGRISEGGSTKIGEWLQKTIR